MLKSIFAATTVAFAAATFAPAYSASMAAVKCDDATMKMVHDAMKADTDPKMAKDVKKADKQMMMAEDAMKAHKMKECAMHIGMAKKDMMMK